MNCASAGAVDNWNKFLFQKVQMCIIFRCKHRPSVNTRGNRHRFMADMIVVRVEESDYCSRLSAAMNSKLSRTSSCVCWEILNDEAMTICSAALTQYRIERRTESALLYEYCALRSFSCSKAIKIEEKLTRKISPLGDCLSTPGKRQIHLPKVELPKFEGHVTLNEDEYQKSERLKFRQCLGDSEYIIHHESFDCMHTGRGDRLWNRPFSQLSDLLDLDLAFESGHIISHGIPSCIALIDLYLHVYIPYFIEIGKTSTVGRAYGHWDRLY